MPRNAKYQPITRLHRRTLYYCFGAVAVFALVYLYHRPIDAFAVPFEQHVAYMNVPPGTHNFVAKDSYDWRKAPFRNKIESYTPLPTGRPHTLPPIQYKFAQETSSQKRLREKRRVAVREEFERSWDSYKKFAWTRDELTPLSGKGDDTFGGWGATLVDSLDTLWIMGFKKEFYEAVEAVATIDFGKSDMSTISVFETTIRYLGGLLAAYDLSGEKVLLDKAIQLGEMLYRAFDTDNNMPQDRLAVEPSKLSDGPGFSSDNSICLAGIGSLTMEFTRLAQVTGQAKYYDAVARVTDFFDRAQNTTRIPGLFPIWVNAYKQDITQDRTFTMGAMADSTYEYFPKMFALLGGLEPVYEKLYKDSAEMIDKHLLYRPMIPDTARGQEILFSGSAHAKDPDHVSLDAEMQHLTCFIGGFFGLAGRIFENDHHVDLGAKLTEGCIFAYSSMPTGVMPEIFDIVACDSRSSCPWNATKWEEEVLRKTYAHSHDDFQDMVDELKLPEGFTDLRDKRYLLRPEAIESVFIMHRITGQEEYMDHAWDMFTSIRKHSSTRLANGQIIDITEADPSPLPEDKMESFWLAETLKYFYLIFSPPDMIDLDDWVFNTEAHPFRRPKWTQTVTATG
ncbi:glycoside hydrolase family 47 protein [Aaosphaeria arxii CBS 175.79]|uniref:alpha-1,2-Mannosidase n=1 Tax=Aaosphaeria arxii CBS 175.79 TaxID=1450172 RepID=A0A6A5Y222_9PLEO|nr:glycoside hydrolase family 47 protein [Aaosphaeria arxii CBS 175.79]KAF2019279.1 glycoside hydrolase family 47 protein [Aaosphaeria arxii CBS 175.79]